MEQRLEEVRRTVRAAHTALSMAGENDDLEALEADLATVLAEERKLTGEMVDGSALFRFESIGRKRYEALIAENPPDETQRKAAKARGILAAWNPDTFPPQIISACMSEPKLSVAEVAELWDHPAWNQSELSLLFDAALYVCHSGA